MNKLTCLLLIVLLAACATTEKPRYQWMNPEGRVATNVELTNVRVVCEYEQKMQEAEDLMGQAQSVGDYDREIGSNISSDYVDKASNLMRDAMRCIQLEGFSTRRIVKPES
mgnify:CR=1 FL=1